MKTASGAETILVECVSRSYSVACCVGIGKSLCRGTLTISCARSINLTVAECCRNREGISTNGLFPVDLLLVGVQLIANLTVSEVSAGPVSSA